MQSISTLLQLGIQKAFEEIYQKKILQKDIRLIPTLKKFEGSHTFPVFQFYQKIEQKPEILAEKIGKYLKEKKNNN